MTSNRTTSSTRHHLTLRKDTHMFHIELRLADVAGAPGAHAIIRDGERNGLSSGRSLRHQVGQSLVRLGRRIGGDAMTAPAWQG